MKSWKRYLILNMVLRDASASKNTLYNQVYVADLTLVKVVWNAKSSFRLKWNDWHLTYSCWEKVSLKVWKAELGQRVFASRRNSQCHSGIAEKAQVSCLLFSCKRIFICFLLLFLDKYFIWLVNYQNCWNDALYSLMCEHHLRRGL